MSGREDAPSAEALMRARYSAYVQADIDFLYRSSAISARKGFDPASTRKWAESAEWKGLDILKASEGDSSADRDTVEFVAHYAVNDQTFDHHEVAEFVRQHGVWRFLDGRVIGPEPIRRDTPKIGRNMPCPCGSGRKFKKCCSTEAAPAHAD